MTRISVHTPVSGAGGRPLLLSMLLAAVVLAPARAQVTPAPSPAPSRAIPAPSPAPSTVVPAAPSWDTLKAAYNYTAPADLAVKTETREDPDYLLLHITFTSAAGQHVPGLYLRPRADGVYPCVLLLHGLGSDKETMVKFFGRPLAARGVASLALDSDLHGERKPADGAQLRNPLTLGMVIHSSILEDRLALDYLKTRKDVDSTRFGLLGYSMGSMIGSIVSGVDDRVKATVLCVGGDPIRAMISLVPPAMQSQVEFLSPSNYIGHISPRPLMMINGRSDKVMREPAVKLIHDAARQPKEILWADSGHILPASAVGAGIEWLAGKLNHK